MIKPKDCNDEDEYKLACWKDWVYSQSKDDLIEWLESDGSQNSFMENYADYDYEDWNSIDAQFERGEISRQEAAYLSSE
jgi:hypothetical protein